MAVQVRHPLPLFGTAGIRQLSRHTPGARAKHIASVAQWIEQPPSKRSVEGSNPSGSAILSIERFPMLTHIQNIQWVGALSLEDADVLAQKSKTALKILEFGPGGSTMIFLQSIDSNASVTCVETRQQWIEELQNRLDLIEHKSNNYEFYRYKDFMNKEIREESFDLIFVDGEKTFREDFARKTWYLLKNGGEMMFHDTKRISYINSMMNVIRNKLFQIESVQFNIKASNGENSNISSIKKTARIEPPNDLQSIEQERELWTFGGIRQHNYTIDKGLFVYRNTEAQK